MALIDKASLLMVPSTYEAGTLYNVLPSGNRAPDSTDQNSGYDQTRADFSFDRGSNAAATRVNSDGLIEKYRENLLTESNNFSDSDWANDDTTETSGFEGYDGTNNAWKLVGNTNASRHHIVQSTSLGSAVYTFSVYAKASGHNFVQLASAQSVTQYVNFDLSNGSVGNSGSTFIEAKAEDVGNGWYRLSVVNTTWQTVGFYISLVSSKTAGWLESWTMDNATDGILFQNAQLETGLVATDYLDSGATTAKAGVLIDLPRINYDANGENGALLLEPQRTNLVQYSEYFDGTGWSKNGNITTTINTDGTKSPEGVYNATLLTSANATSEQQMLISSLSTTSGTSYAFSVFAKKKDYDFIHLRFQGSGGAFAAGSVYFNISSGSVGHEDSGKTGYIENYGNGWYKCTAVATAAATSSGAACRVQLASSDNVASVVGDGVKGTYVYGAGFEAGSYSTSYIPNHGTSGGVTRAADSCIDGGSAESINSVEGVLYAEISALVNPTNQETALSISEGQTGANRLLIRMKTNGAIGMVLRVSNTTEASIDSGVLSQSTNHKIAVKYKVNDIALWIDGVEIGTDSSASVFSANTLNEMSFNQGNGSNHFYGNVKQVAVFNEALSDSELATLTTL